MVRPDHRAALPDPSGAHGRALRLRGHPLYKKSYSEPVGDCTDECDEDWHIDHEVQALLNVHGGVTYSDTCQPGTDESRGICHTPSQDEADDIWWFGFDCSHSGDHCPQLAKLLPFAGDTYRDLAYVQQQCALLAQQLKEFNR